MARDHYYGGSTVIYGAPCSPGRLSPVPLNGEQMLINAEAARKRQERAKRDEEILRQRDKASRRQKQKAKDQKGHQAPGNPTSGRGALALSGKEGAELNWRIYTGVKYIDSAIKGFRRDLEEAKRGFPRRFWELRQCYDEFVSILREAHMLDGETPKGRAHARECMQRFVLVEKWARELQLAENEARRQQRKR